jgi:hypothetical protein
MEISYRNRKKKRVGNEHWPMDKKIAVVQHWLTLGSLKLSASACDVPLDTVRKWKQSPWWAELVADFRTAEDLVLSAKLKRIVESAADATLVYAEREEGLQTGTSVGTQEEAGEGEGESGEEYGEEDDGGPRSGSEG